LTEFKNLLKCFILWLISFIAYQQEIDAISKRSKVAETAYLNVYKLLAEAPDPAPLIAAVAEKSREDKEKDVLELENKRLAEQVADQTSLLITARAQDMEFTILKQRLTTYEARVFSFYFNCLFSSMKWSKTRFLKRKRNSSRR
jgi:homeobox protein cut-like